MSKGTFIIPRIPSHEHFHNWAWSLSDICGTCSANWCFTMLYDHSSRYYPCLGYQPYLCPVCKSSYVQLQVTGEAAALATQSKQSCNESVECRLKWLWQHCTDMVQKQTIYIEMRYGLSFVRSYNSVNLEDDSEATVITLNTSDVLIRCHGTMQE